MIVEDRIKTYAIQWLMGAVVMPISLCVYADKQAGAPSRDDPEIIEMRKKTLKHNTLESQTVKIQNSGMNKQNIEVPRKVLDKMQSHLVSKLGHENIVVKTAQSVVWPDGSMGCPQPGISYIQQQIPGYEVVFLADEKLWRYHSNQGGHFILCEKSVPTPAK